MAVWEVSTGTTLRVGPVPEGGRAARRTGAAEWLAVLSEECRHLLRVGAVLGNDFALADVGSLIDRPVATLLPAVDEALTVGPLVARRETLAFRCREVWQAVLASIPAPVLGCLRAEAEALRRTRRCPEPLLSTVDSSTPSTVDGVLAIEAPADVPAALETAARHFRATAPETASALAVEALQLTQLADPTRSARAVAAVDALVAAGRLDDASALAEEALRGPISPDHAGALRATLASALMISGRADAVRAGGPQAGDPDGAQVLSLFLRDVPAAARIAEQILARRPGTTAPPADAAGATNPPAPAGSATDPAVVTGLPAQAAGGADPAVVPAATVLSNLRWDDGEPAEALRLGTEAVRAIDPTTPPPWRPHARLALAYKLASLRETRAAEALLTEAEAEIGRLGLGGHRAGPMVIRARLLLYAGRPAAARTQAGEALRAGERTEARMYHQLARSVLALAALRAGDAASAAAQVEEFRAEIAARGRVFPAAHFAWTAFRVATDQCDPARTVALLRADFPDLLARPALWYEEPGAAPWLIRAGLAAGDQALVREVAGQIEHLARRCPDLASLACAARHASALRDGDLDGLASVAGAHLDGWAAALAAEDLGSRLTDRNRARDELSLALRRFDELGARRDVARVRHRLRRLGVRSAAGARGGSGTTGWDSLTDIEHTIAYLVSQGLTNRQVSSQVFLSPHTVNYHLRRIFRKLSISSRVELARMVPRTG